MLPDLGGLSLTPTGAVDDVVTEIFKEKEGALRRRYEAEQPPIYTLEPGPFSLIVEELAKRLAPDAATVSARNVETLCAQVHQACRELATLGTLPGQAIDPQYDCYADPDGDVWKAAHVIFGVDPTQLGPEDKGALTWRDNFRSLCQAFDPRLVYEYYIPGSPGSQFVDGGDEDARAGTRPMWRNLWEAVPENRQRAGQWQESRAHDQWETDFENVDSDDEEFEAFDEWYYDNEYDDNPPVRYPVSDDEIRDLQTRLRDRRAPGRRALSDQLRWGIGHIRYELAQGPSNEDRFRSNFSIYESVDEWLAQNGTGQAHEFRIKLDALYRLLGAIMRQATN